MTDEEALFVGIGWNFASHQIVKHTADKYARGDVHTKTVEGFFRSSSVGCTVSTSTSAEHICIAVLSSLISGIATAKSLTAPAPLAHWLEQGAQAYL
jgi:hypothetical protein